MKLLLIDDELECLEGMVIALRPCNFDCTIETNPLAAIELYRKEKFDAVITDIRMTPLSGIDVLKRIRDFDRHARIFLITAYAEEAIPQDSLYRPNGFFTKPLNFEEFIAKLKSIERSIKRRKHDRRVRNIIRKCKKLDPQWVAELPPALYCFIYPIVQDMLYTTGIEEEYRTIFRHKSKRVLKFINRLLDISHCLTGKINFKFSDFNLEYLMEDEIKAFAKHLLDKGIELYYHYDLYSVVWMNSDARRLKQLIYMLLDNAVNFTERGEIYIHISTEPGYSEAVYGSAKINHLHISITDTGTGIPEDKLMTLFNLPNKLDFLKKEQHQDMGMSLPLAKALVERMGGTLSVVSEPEKGSAFTLTLPVRDVTPTTETAPHISEILSGSLL